jgi:iron(III) transport system ATP-binding protein
VDKEAVAFFSDANIIKSKVSGSLADSPFGQFFAPGLDEGTHVEIVIRPQHVRIDFDREGKGPLPTVSMGIPVRGCVERARFLGNESLVEFKMDFDNSIFRVTVPSVFLPKTGQPLWLTIPRDRCFVFPTL